MCDVAWNDEPEWFDFFLTRFDVRAAKRILAARKDAKIAQMPVASAAGWIGKPPRDAHDLSCIVVGGVGVDWTRAASDEIDLGVPVIFAYTKSGGFLPIDGWHRIAKAVLTGVEHLPAVALTKSESKRVRHG